MTKISMNPFKNNDLQSVGRRLFVLLACVSMLCVVGCASNRTLSDADRATIVDRAERRWVALEQRDFGSAYAFTSPAYRSVFTEELYRQKFSYMIDWELTSVEILNYDAGAAVASVAVRVMSRPVKQTSAASAAIGSVPTRFVEQWILEDGEWWFSANL